MEEAICESPGTRKKQLDCAQARTMWGQPPSAVRASEPRLALLATFPNLK
jgi:hypothetical protein